MDKPSAHWQGFTGMNQDSEKYKQIQLLLSSLNFDHLKTRATESRRKHDLELANNIECSINLTQFTSGFENLILELTFSDNVYWVARIPYRTFEDSHKISMLSEIATMRIIRKNTTVPIPQIFDFEASSDQPFGRPYILMESLKGQTVDNGLARSIPRKFHGKVAKQLANVFSELQNLTFSRIGRLWCGEDANQPVEIIAMAWHASPGPLETSLEYFYNQQQSANREIVALHPDEPEWLTACWILKTAFSHIIIEDRVKGPFPLCHLDLHYGNMLFDEEYNLTGIIDWGSAQAAPLEQLSVCPEFVTFPGLSEEGNAPIVEMKKLVVDCLKEMEAFPENRPTVNLTPVDVAKEGSMPLSAFLTSKSAEITLRQYMASPRGSLWAARQVAKLIFGDHVTWEQLVGIYGNMPLF